MGRRHGGHVEALRGALAAAAGSIVSKRPIAAAISGSLLTTKPVSPSITSSGADPSGYAITGVPHAIASVPELFAGFSRTEHESPVPYPVACRPQAWAAGTIPYLMKAGFGLAPAGFERRLDVVRPSLPAG